MYQIKFDMFCESEEEAIENLEYIKNHFNVIGEICGKVPNGCPEVLVSAHRLGDLFRCIASYVDARIDEYEMSDLCMYLNAVEVK